jgi:hypothetical protein
MRTTFSTWTAVALLGGASGLWGNFAFEKTDTQLIVRENGRDVLVFNDGVIEPRGQGTPRSGYIHPLFGLDGDVLTDDFPEDHLHHRGVFFGWPNMTVLGQRVDFWHLRGLRPQTEDLGPIRATPAHAYFEARTLWQLEDGTSAVREHLRYLVHKAEGDSRAIDVHATFTNLTEEPVTLAGNPRSAYGGLNVRMDGGRPDVQILTAGGPVAENQNRVDPPSPWAAYASRPAPGASFSGVAIFQDPRNPDFPAPNWTLRPYGFLGAAWPGEQNHSIAPGESIDLRYRIVVFRGAAAEAALTEKFAEFQREQNED